MFKQFYKQVNWVWQSFLSVIGHANSVSVQHGQLLLQVWDTHVQVALQLGLIEGASPPTIIFSSSWLSFAMVSLFKLSLPAKLTFFFIL